MITSRGKSKLSADNSSISIVPGIAADSPPDSTSAYLHISFYTRVAYYLDITTRTLRSYKLGKKDT